MDTAVRDTLQVHRTCQIILKINLSIAEVDDPQQRQETKALRRHITVTALLKLNLIFACPKAFKHFYRHSLQTILIQT